MTGIWECAAGRMRADFGNDGEEQLIGPGESATFPPHWKGVWTLASPMRKLYCTFKLGG